MKLVIDGFLFLITSAIGCALALACLIVAGVLPSPFVDPGYGEIAPTILGLVLVALALPCTFLLARIGGRATLISVALLQGLLTPLFSVLAMFITAGIIGGIGVFIVPGMIGSVFSFIVAFSVVRAIKYYRARGTA